MMLFLLRIMMDFRDNTLCSNEEVCVELDQQRK